MKVASRTYQKSGDVKLCRLLFSVLVVGAFISGCLTPSAAQLTFNNYEVVTGLAKRQTVLTGFLLGGAMAELAVVNIDDNDDRRLRIYAFSNGTWEPKHDVKLRREVLFVDVANIGGRDRLITYERGRLNWFDPDSATERALVAVTSNFNPPRKDEIPHVDITRDLNGDGRDDLIVPATDGFRLFIQLADRGFADPVKIGSPADLAGIYGADGYRFNPWSESRIYEVDYNRDGCRDLVFWNEDHFEVHHQDKSGLFAPLAKTFTTDVTFDSDKLSSLAVGDMTGRVLHSLNDLNGDGVADLVIFSLQGKSLSSKQSKYEVHFGKSTPDGGTTFDSKIGVTFQSEGRIQIGMDRHDFDRDGQGDLMFRTMEVKYLESSFWKRIKGFMGDDIWLDLAFYRMEGGRYLDKPNAIHRIALDGAPSHREPGWVPLDIVLRGRTHESRLKPNDWPRAFNRTLLIGDVTGDRRSDLLIEAEFMELNVFVGVPGPELFSRQPQKVAVALSDEEYTWLVDLNRDGKQDILIHHTFTLRDAHGARKLPPGNEPHRVTMLIAQ